MSILRTNITRLCATFMKEGICICLYLLYPVFSVHLCEGSYAQKE